MEVNTLLFLLTLIILPILLSAIQNKSRRKKERRPPGPRGLPLIGNFHQVDSTVPLHEYFRNLSKKYGPLLYLKLGSRAVVVANSSRMAEEILKMQDLNLCSRPDMVAMTKLSYGGFDIAFSPYSEYWREMRKICVLHLLSAKRVQSFGPIREDEVSRMIGKISDQAADSASGVVNVTERIVFLTSTIVCRVAFGKRYEQGSGENRKFNHMIQEFQTMLSAFYFTDYFPWLGWVDKVTGKFDRLDKIFKAWDAFYQQLVDEHLDPNRPNLSTDCDVVDIMLQLRKESSGSFNLPLDHIKAVLMNVYFASTDTIATTTVWVLTALIKNPSAMRRAQAEIRAMPSLQNKQMVEENDMAAAKLPYFNAVIKEAMRLHSTIPLLLPRETIDKCTIGGFEIPAKTIVHVNAWAISKDADFWENPNEFMPERFLSDERKFGLDSKGQDFSLVPFGAGRRGCPGITMALATVEIAVANLLYSFDWQLPDGMKEQDVDLEISRGLTAHKKNPLCLVAKKFV